MRKYGLLLLIALFLYPFVSTIGVIVDQRQYAIVFTTGEIKQVITEPGMYFKMPSPVENVLLLDKRALTAEMTEPEKMATAEKKIALVDSFVKWRIEDPRLFYVSFSGSLQQGQDKMLQMMKAALNEAVKDYTMAELLTGDRSEMLEEIQQTMKKEAKGLGIQVVDVRIKRVNYLDNAPVIEQMKAERTRVANETRSNGTAEAERIRADADKQSTIIVAEATRNAQKIRGEGDAKASRLYAQAFGKNPEFAKFYRTLEAYRATFNSRSDVMVVDPSSEFFKYMKHPKASGAK